MLSTEMTPVRRRGSALKTFNAMACAVTIGLAGLAMTLPASAFVGGVDSSLQQQLKQDSQFTEVRRGGAVHGRTAVGPRGGVYHSRTAVRGGAAVRPGRRGVAWARPARYGWPRGGAIAAGAAIGVVTAATAAAWAGAPPASGMCWYYTDPSRTQGFWDYCQ